MIKLTRLTDEEMSKAYISAPEPYKECQMRDVAQAQLSKSEQEANAQLKAELENAERKGYFKGYQHRADVHTEIINYEVLKAELLKVKEEIEGKFFDIGEPFFSKHHGISKPGWNSYWKEKGIE